ncbi:MAG: thioesterase [Pseudomonadota bacterium]
MEPTPLAAGASYEFAHRVVAADSAARLPLEPDDAFPDVLATSRMLALMEIAAARLMQPVLAAGTLSVGVGVELRHAAPTVPDEIVHVKASFVGMRGALYEFEIQVRDRAGLAGAGRHTRAAVSADGFRQQAMERFGAALQ